MPRGRHRRSGNGAGPPQPCPRSTRSLHLGEVTSGGSADPPDATQHMLPEHDRRRHGPSGSPDAPRTPGGVAARSSVTPTATLGGAAGWRSRVVLNSGGRRVNRWSTASSWNRNGTHRMPLGLGLVTSDVTGVRGGDVTKSQKMTPFAPPRGLPFSSFTFRERGGAASSGHRNDHLASTEGDPSTTHPTRGVITNGTWVARSVRHACGERIGTRRVAPTTCHERCTSEPCRTEW